MRLRPSVLFMLTEIKKLKQMWLFLNVLCVSVQSLIKFYVIIFYILYPMCFNIRNTPLVIALLPVLTLLT